eukprot:TRINITY_DN19399_c0_g1_i1.p1 TRINITY_DN19399_c0_g1~~TRINITY_DN19399_c0_g1_i1.p1  ORF type:complete len:147 (+),score=42.79 TRINITY_DN19399_c0_g1_i1:32-442(+)
MCIRDSLERKTKKEKRMTKHQSLLDVVTLGHDSMVTITKQNSHMQKNDKPQKKQRINLLPIRNDIVLKDDVKDFKVCSKTTSRRQELTYQNVERYFVYRDKGKLNRARAIARANSCLLQTSPSPRDLSTSRMPSSA